MADLEKYLDERTNNATTDPTPRSAELTQLAWKHITDGESLHTIKTQFQILTVGPYTPSWGVCVEIPPFSGDAPKSYSWRLSERNLSTGMGE